MSLEIDDSLLESIRAHGRSQYPNECCGLILGGIEDDHKRALHLSPQENTRADSPQNRYLIAPAAMLAAEKDARSRGLDIVGVYHSHPDHPARPSEFDREHAVPWYSYIIVGVTAGSDAELTCWTLRDDRSAFEEEPLVGRTSARGEIQGAGGG